MKKRDTRDEGSLRRAARGVTVDVAGIARASHRSLDRAVRLLNGLRTWRASASRRATADEWLLWGAEPRTSSELLSWRARELVAPHQRKELARLCRRFLAERGDPRCRAYAVNRVTLGRHLHLLRELADTLEDASRPVTPRGMILASRVLRDGAGPFFNTARADELGPMLSQALSALVSDRGGSG